MTVIEKLNFDEDLLAKHYKTYKLDLDYKYVVLNMKK